MPGCAHSPWLAVWRSLRTVSVRESQNPSRSGSTCSLSPESKQNKTYHKRLRKLNHHTTCTYNMISVSHMQIEHDLFNTRCLWKEPWDYWSGVCACERESVGRWCVCVCVCVCVHTSVLWTTIQEPSGMVRENSRNGSDLPNVSCNNNRRTKIKYDQSMRRNFNGAR